MAKANAKVARKQFGGEAFMTQQRFDALPLKATLLRALREVFQYETMSKPQAAAIPIVLEGRDVLLRSATGSGKTLTFLLAALQRQLASTRLDAGQIGVLILTPLREVALQTQAEAAKLLHFLPSRGAQVVIGGADMKKESRALERNPCDLLVATPGRLLDHLQTNPAFAARLRHVHTVVLDETDRMLDVGFLPAVRKIFAYLAPREERQAILVSATIDERVKEVSQTLMRPGYAYLNTGAETTQPQVNERIALRLQQVEPERILFALEEILVRDPKKTLVFMPASNWASFAAQLLRAAGHAQVTEFHGKLEHKQRVRTLQRFAADPKGVLIASDAAARGLDIADIDRVIQVGITDVAGFIQRSGRTARAGRTGEAIWLLGTDETKLLQEFAKISLEPLAPGVRGTPSASLERAVASVADDAVLRKVASRAFSSLLGAYAAPRKRLGWDAQKVADAIKARFVRVGLSKAPAIEAKTLAKMNLKGVEL